MAQIFTGADFVKALADGTLKEGLIQEGMVKQDETDPSALQFSEGMACSRWIKIPLGMIERVEFLRFVDCRDHHHPFVRLHLKNPSEGSEASVFAALLRNTPSGRFASQAQETDTAIALASASATAEPWGALIGGALAAASGLVETKATADSAESGTGIAGELEGARDLAAPAAGNSPIASFTFNNYYGCVYVYQVHVYRWRRNDNRWRYAVQIQNTWVQTFGSCSCGPIPGRYRTGRVRARITGTGGGFLDTGDMNVHSGGGAGGDKWQYFDPANPGNITNCQVFGSSECTF